MVTTCFFCQNLLSEYIEGVLPSVRHDEITRHLNVCEICKKTKGELDKTLSLLLKVDKQPLSQSVSIRVEEACLHRTTSLVSRQKLFKYAAVSAVPVVLVLILFLVFPSLFPWFSYLRNYEDESNFSRYFPLLQGAGEIIDEQANWLNSRESLNGSLWEEGGMSPEEYEKAFQKKAHEESAP